LLVLREYCRCQRTKALTVARCPRAVYIIDAFCNSCLPSCVFRDGAGSPDHLAPHPGTKNIGLALLQAQSRNNGVYKPPFPSPLPLSSSLPTLLFSLPPPLLYSASSFPISLLYSHPTSCTSHPPPFFPSSSCLRFPSCQRFSPDVFTPTVSSKKNIASLAACERARFLFLFLVCVAIIDEECPQKLIVCYHGLSIKTSLVGCEREHEV
jgi:hypothetical protein